MTGDEGGEWREEADKYTYVLTSGMYFLPWRGRRSVGTAVAAESAAGAMSADGDDSRLRWCDHRKQKTQRKRTSIPFAAAKIVKVK